MNTSFLQLPRGPYDNPKMNAFMLLKRDVQRIPWLKSLHKDTFYRDIEDSASIRGANKKKILNGQHRKLVSNEEDTETESPRKTSGQQQTYPYSMDDSTLLLPVFIAIGAFIPLLFCLCKL
ncbi:malectin-like isoform 2-T5 [Glossina fuscipes fuscipes]